MALMASTPAFTSSESLSELLQTAVRTHRQGLFEDSCRALRQAIELAPTSESLITALARLLHQLNRPEEAQQLLQAQLERSPACLSALLGMAELAYRDGQLHRALALYRQVVALDGNHLGATTVIEILLRQGIGETSVESHESLNAAALIQAAEEAYARHDQAQALHLFEQARLLDPTNSDLEVAEARCRRELGDHDQAESILLRCLDRQANLFSAVLGMAELEVARNRQPAALAWYRQAHALQPVNTALTRTLIACLQECGCLEEVDELLEQELASQPDEPALLAARVDSLVIRGDLPLALKLSERLVGLPGSSSLQRLQHLSLLRRAGRLEAALQALDSFPTGGDHSLNSHALQLKGQILCEQGLLQEGLEALFQAVRLSPTTADHAVVLANILADVGAHEDGLDILADSERFIALEQGLTVQPWLQFVKVRFFRSAGDLEAALAIAEGLCQDPQVGFYARQQRFELLCQLGDPRTELALESLAPLDPAQKRLETLSRSRWWKSTFRFDEAFKVLAPLLDGDPLDLTVAEEACLLLTLVLDLPAAQDLFFRIRSAKQSSGNNLLSNTAYHGMHRCLLEEFNTNGWTSRSIRALWTQKPADRLAPLVRLQQQEPECHATALSLLICARQAGRFNEWAGADASECSVPKQIVQYWGSQAVPDGVRSLMQSWLQASPTFEHQIFLPHDAAEFLEHKASDIVYQAFRAARSAELRADLFGLAYLNACGGVVVGADDRCRHSLAAMLSDGLEVLLLQDEFGFIAHNFLAAVPGHPFVAKALEMAASFVLERQGSHRLFLTGSGILTLCWSRLYGAILADPAQPSPPGVRVLSQQELSRRVSFQLKTPGKLDQSQMVQLRGTNSPPPDALG